MTRALAAVDLGAQSGRVAVGRFDGARLAVDVVHRFANEPVERDGALRWDLDTLQGNAEAGLRKAARSGPLDAIGVDSWAVDFGLLGDDGRVLADPVHYRDARRAAAFASVLERVPPRELYRRTGIQLLPINTIFELAAMVDAGERALQEAETLLMIPDLFHHRLCGSVTTERTNATTTQCLDPAANAWATDVLERLEIPTAIFPDVVEPGTVLGAVSADAAERTGLGGAEVIATATHDTAAAVAAVPAAGERWGYLSVGTWSLVGVESPEPVVSDTAYHANLTNEGGVEGTVRVLRNLTGLWLLHECRRAWAAGGRDYEFAQLVELARTAPPLRSLVEPNDARFTEPGDMPARIAEFCRETGQDVPSDAAAVVRCVLESLALKHAETVDVIAEVTGRTLDELHVVGGGANNDLLCAWTAEASGRPVLAGPTEATLVGNLVVQAIALGELASVAEGRELVRRSFPLVRYEPTGDGAWAEARERFGSLHGVAVGA